VIWTEDVLQYVGMLPTTLVCMYQSKRCDVPVKEPRIDMPATQKMLGHNAKQRMAPYLVLILLDVCTVPVAGYSTRWYSTLWSLIHVCIFQRSFPKLLSSPSK
jgi:hypothetical protein